VGRPRLLADALESDITGEISGLAHTPVAGIWDLVLKRSCDPGVDPHVEWLSFDWSTTAHRQ